MPFARGPTMNFKNRILIFSALVIFLIAAIAVSWEAEPDPIIKVAKYKFSATSPIDASEETRALEKRVAEHPQALDLSALASHYFRQGQISGDGSLIEKAKEAAENSLRLMSFNNSSSEILLARIAESRHEFSDAIRRGMAVLKKDSGRVSVLGLLANSELAIGDLPDATEHAEQYVDRMPGLESYGLRALIYAAQGRDSEAQSDFIRALEIEDVGELKESVRIRCLFARYLLRRGEYEHASVLLNEALRALPNYHLAFLNFGEIEMRQGNFKDAAIRFQSAFESSKQLAYMIHLARAKAAMADAAGSAEIRALAETLLRNEIKNSGIGHRLDLVTLLLDRGNAEDVKEALGLAIAERESRHSSTSLLVLARAYLAAGLVTEARRTSRQILRSGIRDSDVYDQAAAIELAIGNSRQAAFYTIEAKTIRSQN